MPAGDPRNEAESTIASLWARKDPAAAANWLAALPANEQPNVVTTIANYWVESNWPEASRWITTLTGEVRDEALAAAVYREGATPNDSLSLALSIGNEEMRNNAVENIIRSWAATKPNEAETWVKGSPLSSEQRDYLRSVVSETRQSATEGERVIIVH
jgi:Tfp pilus assembly major pilin PilA